MTLEAVGNPKRRQRFIFVSVRYLTFFAPPARSFPFARD